MIQFTAPQEYVDLLEKAKNLSAFEARLLVEIHVRAMRALVAELEKRRCGATSKRATTSAGAPPAEATHASELDGNRAEASEIDRTAGAQAQVAMMESVRPSTRAGGADLAPEPEETRALPRLRRDSGEPPDRDTAAEPPPEHGDDDDGADPRGRRGRHVPRAVRRAVWQRDEGRCTYVDERGVRCRETACLELDHELAHARGGPPTATNLRLSCRAHNQLNAENDFGREFMDRKKGNAAALPELALSDSVAESA